MTQHKKNTTFDNKKIVGRQFDKWVNGSGNFFNPLANVAE